jgi:hypothetical protein
MMAVQSVIDMSAISRRRLCPGIVFLVACGLTAAWFEAAQADGQEARPSKKPSLTLKASPMMGVTPAKIRFVAEVKDGPDDYEDLYCPTVEWDWDDDTTSESSVDCKPYQPGKSQITRRFTVEHIFRNPGEFRVKIRLKKKTRVVLFADIQVHIGLGIIRDPGPTSPQSF